jgi:S-adenosylmethionine decarboxylase
MHGLHLTADLCGCPATLPLMTDSASLRHACSNAVQSAGLTVVAELFHAFAPHPQIAGPAGVTGVLLLAESHLAVHTWPESGTVTLDVYVCNLGEDNSAKARAVLDQLCLRFHPQSVQRQQLFRGGDPLPAAQPAHPDSHPTP